MSLAAQILAHKAGREVSVGEVVEVCVDLCMGHDGTASLVVDEMDASGCEIAAPETLLLVCDHFSPPATQERAAIQKKLIDFAEKRCLPIALNRGICHQLILEDSRCVPGGVVIGADSHTVTGGAVGALATGVGATDFMRVLQTGSIWLRVPEAIRIVFTGRLDWPITGRDLMLEVLRHLGSDGAIYKSLEFFDETEAGISMDQRAALSNMSVETGAKCGIFVPDCTTNAFLRDRDGGYESNGLFEKPGVDAYENEIRINCDALEPLVAAPADPGNVHPVVDFAGTKVDQVFIGSCSCGRLEDLAETARLLAGRQVHPRVKVIVIPASQSIFLDAIERGCIAEIIRAGAAVSNPSCGPCCAIDKGALSAGEVCVSTSNRNFPGRMGHPDSHVFLASVPVAVAAALAGEIRDPREVRA
ncbi:3-isopropylmalate dehydratase [Oceanidesulfovibrio indonesiensis]|uniref:3-isopropylmalate dehydratase n=1 Tax=Oceanidesulfovibrio indonesiensis TaxID=54767 RepID=A0A7M3MHN5_9BACT|nr:aconitase/3-isopropylmalate dehydratase large subunit family protein [Oceanidesulfovibrio indonesiensis]TVM19202.1 3-isopropylmalate dehydratase [Oceanidesulfovibrio indonesiensis]